MRLDNCNLEVISMDYDALGEWRSASLGGIFRGWHAASRWQAMRELDDDGECAGLQGEAVVVTP